MRWFLITQFIFISIFSNAQKVERFYNYDWKECAESDARFYSITMKTDSGFYRREYYLPEGKLINRGLFEDSSCKILNGELYVFRKNGFLSQRTNYIHGKPSGASYLFHPDGSLFDSSFYENGKLKSKMEWYSNGNPADSTVWDKDGKGVEVAWCYNGNPDKSGNLINWKKKNGIWQYFHSNGKLSSLENYTNDVLIKKRYFDELGNEMDTTNKDKIAEFPGGRIEWLRYLEHNLEYPKSRIAEKIDNIIVGVMVTIDEDGKVIGADVETFLQPDFDKIAIALILKSPKWIPAFQHNRRVRFKFSQSITFQNR